jgi:hypothetical protein
MKTFATVLVLLALFVLVPCTESVAQTPPAAAAPVAMNTTDFLATLSAEVLPPSPTFLATTSCTTNADCPTGKLCCYPCGIDGCERRCLTPLRGRCPLFP